MRVRLTCNIKILKEEFNIVGNQEIAIFEICTFLNKKKITDTQEPWKSRKIVPFSSRSSVISEF
jgi:hypothetical protein